MNAIQELETMLQEEVLPELEHYIDDLFEKIADTKSATLEDKEALKEMQELRDDFKQMLTDLQSGDMQEDECEEIIEELIAMREDPVE